MWPLVLELSHPHLVVPISTAASAEFETVPIDPGVVISILHGRKSCHWLKCDVSLGNGLLVFTSRHFGVILLNKAAGQLLIFVSFHDVFQNHFFFLSFDAIVVMGLVVLLRMNVLFLCVCKFFFDSVYSRTRTARKDIPFSLMGVVFVRIMFMENICSFKF